MKLAADVHGHELAPPLVVLHGLYGSSRNWRGAARALAERFRVFALDLRDHGESPHSTGLTYPEMSADVVETMDALGLDRVVLMGHSLGGKTAMRVACDRPGRVEHLLVVDISARANEVDPRPLEAMQSVDLDDASTRADVDRQLAESLHDVALRQFLMTNLQRLPGPGEEDRGFAWKLNLDAIADSLDSIGASPLRDGDRFEGPMDLLAGGRSGYIRPGDLESLRSTFSLARLTVFEESGHDVHFEVRDAFVAKVFELTGVQRDE